jgi:NAD(P)-dependent dehydrogenase (short-subunit alcohol dehydrogenase family)
LLSYLLAIAHAHEANFYLQQRSSLEMDVRKKVVVTGASSGIGSATANRFGNEGWDVCVTARRENELNELVSKLPEGKHLVCAGDYSDPTTSERIGARISSEWGGHLDVLANVAGVYFAADSIDSSLSEWRKSFDIMVNGAVFMTRMAVPLMKDGGRIIHVTSIHGDRAEMGSSSYSMAKAAINQYCRALALELAPRGILVNALAPGFISTPMSVVNGVNELESEWFKTHYVVGHHLPLKRAGEPEEVSGVIYFLAGPDASYLTGQVITVDGGLTITF